MCNIRTAGHGDPHHCGPRHGGSHHGRPHHFGPPFGLGFFHRMKHRWQNFMPYTLEETDSEYIIKMPLPGFAVKDVDCSVKENFIYIEAQKPEEEKESQPRIVRSMGEFLWNRPHIAVKVYIDEKIKPDTVKAKLAKGILIISVEKIPGTKVNIEE